MPENKAPATTIQTTVLPNIMFIINLYSIRQRGAIGTTLSLHRALLQNKASAKSTQLLRRRQISLLRENELTRAH
jgi:hypothetical protein